MLALLQKSSFDKIASETYQEKTLLIDCTVLQASQTAMKVVTTSVLLTSWMFSLYHVRATLLFDPLLPFGEWNDTEFMENSTVVPTIDDSMLGDVSVSEIPVQTPAPTVSPPTASPATIVQIEGEVPLQLTNTPSLLIGETETLFLAAVGDFLYDNVRDGVGGYALEVIEVKLSKQYREPSRRLAFQTNHRNLQNATVPLYVELRIVGLLESSDGDISLFNFNTFLKTLFEAKEQRFITLLQSNSKEPFFDEVISVKVVTANAASTNYPTESPVAPSGVDNIDGADQSSREAKASPWSIGVIVGIAAAGAVVLILLLAVVCRLASNKTLAHEALPDARVAHSESSGTYDDSKNKQRNTSDKVTEKRKRWSAKSKDDKSNVSSDLNTKQEEEAPKNSALEEQTSLGTVSDLESQGLYSYAKNDSDSVMGASIMYNNSVMGMDNMSYAYSLEPGIEASVVAGYSGDQSTIIHDESRLPMEIPQITVIKNKKSSAKRGSNKAKPSPKSSLEASLNKNIEDTAREFQLSASDLKLTESELAMLPSNLRDSNDDEDASEDAPAPPTRVVVAPPGKLGIVIDTTVDGPVVHHVNDVSALKGKIFPGDIIVGIDNVDTKAMSASAITALMVKTANQKRRLTVLENKKGKINKKTTSRGKR